MLNFKTIFIQASFFGALLGTAEAWAAGGDVAWVLKQATIATDSLGRTFRQTYVPDNKLALIDRKTGMDVWARASSTRIQANAMCNDSNKVYLVADGKFEALNPDDGHSIWVLAGADESSSFYCEPNFESLILTSGFQNTVVRLVHKTSGQLMWTYESGGAVSYTTKDDQNIYLQKFENGVPTIIALRQTTGAVVWVRTLEQGDWSFHDATNHIFIGSNNTYQKLDKYYGHTLWTVVGNGSDEYLDLQSFKNGVIFAQQGQDIRRLDPESGAVLWQYQLPQPLDSLDQKASFLSTGEIVINTLDPATGIWSFSIINDQGAVKWSSKAEVPGAFLVEDTKGNLFVRGKASLTALNKGTGAVLWSFVRENAPANQSIFYFDTYGDDVFMTYGIGNGRYPPMGLIRIDAATGVLQWDKWVNETLAILSADDELVVTEGPMGSKIVGYQR